AWFSIDFDEEDHLHEVGLLKPNNFGVYDIQGNTMEWVLDKCTNELIFSTHPDPIKYSSRIDFFNVVGNLGVIRNESFYTSRGAHSAFAKSSSFLDNGNYDLGFRIVKK
ncbi:MAG: SUMF1/EgtB/PvdO family nonheme iron enzyme, partial [Lentisphaeria bacterium]|nr:SUMF1/EgtB/PvdO family nonheme iron enzyme [Lentisphaeria bacterium]